MTKRDFFILIIKLFGLFSVIASLLSVLPSSVSFAIMDFDLFSIIWVITVVTVVIGLFIILIFKAEKLVDWLKLDSGFDDDRIELGNLSSADIIKIGTFIIGGFLILENIPACISHAFYIFKGDLIGMGYKVRGQFNLAVSVLNLIIGYLLLTNYDLVAKLFKTERKE